MSQGSLATLGNLGLCSGTPLASGGAGVMEEIGGMGTPTPLRASRRISSLAWGRLERLPTGQIETQPFLVEQSDPR